VCIYLYIPNY
jgi:hypothetical protein